MKDKTFITILLAICTIWLIGFTFPKMKELYFPEKEVRVDTLTYTDTLYFESKRTDSIPKIVYQTVTQRDTLYLHDKDSDIMIPRMIIHKKKEYSDTLQMGQDTLLYTATVTGRSYEDEDLPRLDSISFILRGFDVKEKEVITIEKIIKQRQNKRHFGYGIGVGVGYGLINKKPDVFVGVGFSYIF